MHPDPTAPLSRSDGPEEIHDIQTKSSTSSGPITSIKLVGLGMALKVLQEISDSARESEAEGAYEELQRLINQVRCARAWFDQLADGSYGPEVAAFATQVAPSLWVADGLPQNHV